MAQLFGNPSLQLPLPDFLMRMSDSLGIDIICCKHCGCGTETYAPGYSHYGVLKCPRVFRNNGILPEHILTN